MVFAVIGDVVGSRKLADRQAAQSRLNQALDQVSDSMSPLQRLEPTVGDEFQGVFGGLSEAVSASLVIRLELLPSMDVRCGIGEGQISVHDARRKPVLQDGPAWWAARAALDRLGHPAQPSTRTWFSGLEQDYVNAYLLVRDALVARFGDRHRRWLLMSLRGLSQSQIAEAEGVSRSAVSQAFTNGLGALRSAAKEFGEPQ